MPDHRTTSRHPPETSDALRGRAWKRCRGAALAVYFVLLVMSGVWNSDHPVGKPPDPGTAGREVIQTRVPLMTSAGPGASGQTINMAACRWKPERQDDDRLPVILIHGGPGRGRDFDRLASLLADARTVYAPDLLGFGETDRDVPDYSILANARTVLAWMDIHGIARAHVLGWSQGGGVVLHMADLQPARIASLTLLAAIGVQETEGSRSYAFEHVRYQIGDIARQVVPRLIPSFGLVRVPPPAFTRYFADSDQRPLHDVMTRLRVPTLIMHGERDFLVNPWAAEEHARLISGAKLVMTGSTHFLPFWPDGELLAAAGSLKAFWTSAEAGRAFESPAAPPAGAWGAVKRTIIHWPWWVVAGVLAVVGGRRAAGSYWATAIGALLIAEGLADYGVVLVGLWVGAWVWLALEVRRGRKCGIGGAAREWDERAARGAIWTGAVGILRPDLRGEVGRAVGALSGRRVRLGVGAAAGLTLHRPVLVLCSLLACSWLLREVPRGWGVWGVAVAAIGARIVAGVVDHLLTIPGRAKLRASLVRATRFEFWPTWLVYLGIAPTFVRGAVAAGHPLAWSACNAGIENGGGVVGESKFGIMDALRRDVLDRGVAKELARACCRTWLIEPGQVELRALVLDQIMHQSEQELRYPLILKPEVGQRGSGVRVVRSREDAVEYFRRTGCSVLVQPWHPGPGEVGVLWLRRPRGEEAGGELAGSIFSVTLKNFSFVEGDGERTLEQLIYAHPRYRLQAGRFMARLAGRRLDVPGPGERVPIALAGNHCQGTLFRDGAHLITPGLERSVDAICRAFCGRVERDGLDAARLDIRYRSEEDLRAGRLDPDAIVEINGTFGETTNIYDPDKPVSWSLGYLRRQWEAMYALGRERMDEGARPMSTWRFAGLLLMHVVRAKPSELAD